MKEKFIHGPLAGYLLASVIFTILMYVMLWDHRKQEIKGCQERNISRMEVNERGDTLKTLIKIELAEGDHNNNQLTRQLSRVNDLPILDCSTKNPPPWPFDLF